VKENENVRPRQRPDFLRNPAEAGLSEVAIQFVVTSTLDRRSKQTKRDVIKKSHSKAKWNGTDHF